MAERDHRSIGEVLTLLQDEFPDVTISKIRFLESQGLISPERTPSGYRKFYDADVKLLRWILTQQREHFLPLKVIKERLDAGQVDLEDAGDAPSAPRDIEELASGADESPSAPERAGTRRAAPLDGGPSGLSLSRQELLDSAGLSRSALAQLERFGLVEGRAAGDDVFYDEEALLVARLAADFMAHGVEARHLRMYKVAAEREANLYEQVLLPRLRQRNPAARQEAMVALERLTDLGDGLRTALLRQALRDALGRR